MPELLERAVQSYNSTSPNVKDEGFNGYMEIKVSFMIQDLESFNQLWNKSRVYPSERTEWYSFIRTNVSKCMKE